MMGILGCGVNPWSLIACLETHFPFHTENGSEENSLLPALSGLLASQRARPIVMAKLIQGLMFPRGIEIHRWVSQGCAHSAVSACAPCFDAG